jgi:hypothetical protein
MGSYFYFVTKNKNKLYGGATTVSVWGPKVCCVGKMQYAELICTNPALFTLDAQNTTYVSLSKVTRKLVKQSL